jgi:NADH-quinone oxidoreductase subunit N
VVIALVASAVAAFFYLRVIVLMYMQEYVPEPEETSGFERAPLGRVAVAVPAIATLVFGVFPGLLFGLLKTASVIRF